jgi:hypothetical protein
MITPSQLFNEATEVIEVVEESIEDKQTLEEEISHSVSLIDGAFKNIQEQILSSNRKELTEYKDHVIEVYNICNDIKENQLPKYKKEVIQSDLRTDSKITQLRQEFYETLDERIEETKETIKVFFREEVKDLNKLRESVLTVEQYIKNTPNTIFELRDQVFAELRKRTDANEEVIREKLDKIGYQYEVLQEGLLNEPPSTKTEDPLTPLDQNFVTFEQLQQHYKVFVNRVQQQMATVGGGGEVRLEFLDDIDRSTALIDGRVLQYDASAGIWTGGIGGGGGGSGFSGNYNDLSNLPTLFSGNYGDLSGSPTGIVTATGIGQSEFLSYNGSEYVGISSTGFRDYVIDQAQGYYAYTTDYYTVGVANTTQEIEEGVWTLLQPQVASNGLYNYQPTCMDESNSGDPWVGSGATVGTGQTEFSLAGTKPGTSCIVRSVFRFEPDTDETDLDMRLHFTTNTATQGTGLTNFNIEKQALVMTVGAAVTYSSETLISFFVGDTLSGLTTADAGSFCVEVNGTTDGTLEVLGLTVMVDI